MFQDTMKALSVMRKKTATFEGETKGMKPNSGIVITIQTVECGVYITTPGNSDSFLFSKN